MKRSVKPFNLQMNLPLLHVPATAVPNNQQKELTVALMELLVNAARENIKPQSNGGDHECETHA